MKMKMKTSKAGFSLVEVIVAVSVLVITSTMMLTGYTQYRRNATLKQTDEAIAMTIRQAQAYGLSTRTLYGIGVSGYGVHFIKSSANYYLFADNDGSAGNKKYDDGIDEIVNTYSISTGDSIIDLCGDGDCINNSLTTADIVFTRPNPIVKLTGDGILVPDFASIHVIVQSLDGQTKTIKIYKFLL